MTRNYRRRRVAPARRYGLTGPRRICTYTARVTRESNERMRIEVMARGGGRGRARARGQKGETRERVECVLKFLRPLREDCLGQSRHGCSPGVTSDVRTRLSPGCACERASERARSACTSSASAMQNGAIVFIYRSRLEASDHDSS